MKKTGLGWLTVKCNSKLVETVTLLVSMREVTVSKLYQNTDSPGWGVRVFLTLSSQIPGRSIKLGHDFGHPFLIIIHHPNIRHYNLVSELLTASVNKWQWWVVMVGSGEHAADVYWVKCSVLFCTRITRIILLIIYWIFIFVYMMYIGLSGTSIPQILFLVSTGKARSLRIKLFLEGLSLFHVSWAQYINNWLAYRQNNEFLPNGT